MVSERTTIKRSMGQYFTVGNPFSLEPFKQWAKKIKLSQRKILEPFAGANYIIRSLELLGLCNQYDSFDVVPRGKDVNYRDTIASFPEGYEVCVTNPPWLAKNSAAKLGFPFPKTRYDDLYKYSLSLCLQHCSYVATLIPASYLQSEMFRQRLSTYILLHDKSIFKDTQNPVCLALFDKEPVKDTSIYYDNQFIGKLGALESHIPPQHIGRVVKFNDPLGNLGLVTFDCTSEPSIKFCTVDEIKHHPIKVSSRFFVRITCDVEDVSLAISNLNERIEMFRKDTSDLFLTPFKGLRKDGLYRRRMSFEMARRFIHTLDNAPILF